MLEAKEPKKKISVRSTLEEVNRICAVVNGEPITQDQVDALLRMRVKVCLLSHQGKVTKEQAEREIRELEKKALDDLIDRKLILAEFERKGGQIKDKYIEEAVSRFVKENFAGDTEKLQSELKKSGITMAEFRDLQRDQIAIQALTEQVCSGVDSIPETPWEKKAHSHKHRGNNPFRKCRSQERRGGNRSSFSGN